MTKTNERINEHAKRINEQINFDFEADHKNAMARMARIKERMRANQKTKKPVSIVDRYEEAKKESGGAVLLFKMGDFYELFRDDAKLASDVLGLTLTTRGKRGSADPVPMAGFVHHQLDRYLAKLVKAGHRVAVVTAAD